MDILVTVILALIQGAAELLPVSSSAHVILVGKFFGFDPTTPQGVLLLLLLHSGTMVAVLIHYRKRWMESVAVIGLATFVKFLAFATVATALVGFGLKQMIERLWLKAQGGGEIETLFGSTPLIAAALMATAIVIAISAKFSKTKLSERTLDSAVSIWIGAVQGLCLPFRGFSRSGATISAGILSGLNKAVAETFSFALAIILTPPLFLRELLRLRKEVASGDLEGIQGVFIVGSIGFLVSAVSGYFALKWLSRWVEQGKWGYFAYYCAALSLVVFALYFSGQIL